MSKTSVFYPIATALLKAEELLDTTQDWQAVNQEQERFLSDFFKPCKAESQQIPEIESTAAFEAEQINRFLRERGFQIALRPFPPGEEGRAFGVASVLDLLVQWTTPGTATTLQARNGQTYPAARLKESSSFFQAEGHEYPVARLETTGQDQVYLTRFDQPRGDFSLLQTAQNLATHLQPRAGYGALVVPVLDLKQEEDIGWLTRLIGHDAQGRAVSISQALQETHLALNEQGARAQSAVATAVRPLSMRMPEPDLVLDSPFLIWFQRPGLSQPLFVGYITEEDWKRPQGL